MQKLLILLFFLPFAIFGQERYLIKGKVLVNGEALAFCNVVLDKDNKYAVSDEKGRFRITDVKAGNYVITISSIGYATLTQNISVNKNLDLTFTLEESVEALDDVTVLGKSKTAEISEKAIPINSLSVKPLADLSLGAEEVLKTSTGVVVRQSGGLGSPMNINLNGLTGQAVRIYYDGIPIQVYGYGIQLNNIPVDALQRVDVYKGVMPIDVGTDALGGGINLIPVEQTENQLRASYSIGSFNTHRLSMNGNKGWNDKTSLSISSFFNHSDNDYRMRNIPNIVENLDDEGNVVSVSEEIIDARRFHNAHTSSFIETALTLKNRTWTDKLVFATSYSYRFDEIQQGRFIINTAVGEAESKINGFTQRLDYRKKLFRDKLNVRYFGILSNAASKISDSTTSIYNWRGEKLVTPNSVGSEIFTIPTLREGRDLGTAHRLLLNLKLAENTSLKLSEFYRYTRIKGNDPVGRRLNIQGEEIDPNTIPSKLSRNIVGTELEHHFFDNKLTAIAFYKNYNYTAESIDILSMGATALPIRKIEDAENGYGFALKYNISPLVFIRGSFEKAIRIPTEFEVFGDYASILPNYNLRPESSNNINAGISLSTPFGEEGYVSLKIDGFIRDQKNLIRLDMVGIDNAKYINEAAVDGKGIEVSTKITPIRNLDVSANVTYQGNEIAGVGDTSSEASIGLQVPNIPSFFYNVGVNYQIENVFRSPNNLRLFWTYFFTDRFSINEVQNLDTANPNFVIPKQNLHNAGITYVLAEKGLSFSVNVQNVFNAEIFDNFRIPRPGSSYAFKINYTL